MDYRILFSVYAGIVALDMIATVIISRRNVVYLLARGARIIHAYSGVGKLNTLLRLGWGVSMLAEVWLLERRIILPLTVIAAIVVVIALCLRWGAIYSLGKRWTLPTVVLPGVPRAKTGLYRVLRHPSWLGVTLEIVSVPLLHNAYLTAIVFLIGELLLLNKRMRVEEHALAQAESCRNPGAAEGPVNTDKISVCIIGAGAAGLATAKTLRHHGIGFEVLEQADCVGGIWAGKPGSPLCKNTHAISPKSVQAFSDLPMPEHFPDFPHHSLINSYLQSYAEHHGLLEHIRFNAKVEKVEKCGDGWTVQLQDGSQRRYRDLILASGDHHAPNIPNYPGTFNGEIRHSKDYGGPDSLKGKRVLVVGAGQSALDILCDAAIVADKVFHSTRRAFICAPRYLFGRPFEELQDKPPPFIGSIVHRLPLHRLVRLTAWISGMAMYLNGLSNRKLGLPALRGASEAIGVAVDQKIYSLYTQGDIRHKPGIRRLVPDGAEFEDGTTENFDALVYATGYKVHYPFIGKQALNWQEPGPHPLLYRHIFHPDDPHLFVIGMIRPIGAHWLVFERQAALVATYLLAREQGSSAEFDLQRQRRAAQPSPGEIGFMVNKYRYIGDIMKDTVKLASTLAMPPHPAENTSCGAAPADLTALSGNSV